MKPINQPKETMTTIRLTQLQKNYIINNHVLPKRHRITQVELGNCFGVSARTVYRVLVEAGLIVPKTKTKSEPVPVPVDVPVDVDVASATTSPEPTSDTVVDCLYSLDDEIPKKKRTLVNFLAALAIYVANKVSMKQREVGANK